ncbi:MAG: peptidyl-prolyl cis-trans isomerase [Acidobacteria bacterium]|nr:peptidyl-prolyl cis-trans isomerase [Acidobacteriota bacterium]
MNSRLLGALTLTLLLFAAVPGDAQSANPVVVIETNLGSITMELDPAKAPVSVENFLTYVKAGFYTGTTFHRVIKGFMIQGGGITADMQRKPTRAAIKNEANNGLKNKRGTISMARTNEVNSATSQFFINTVDNAALDYKDDAHYGYAVFGKVIAGMDVVDKIEGTKTKPGDVPVETVTIKAARVKTS